MKKLRKIISLCLVTIISFSTVSAFAFDDGESRSGFDRKKYINENVENYDKEYIEVSDVENYKIYDQYNDEYRIILQLDNEGYLQYVYKYNNDENNYKSGEIQTSFSASNVTEEELQNLSKDVIELDSQTNEIYFIEGPSPQRASLSRAIGYMKDLRDYRAPVSGRNLGSVTRQGVTAKVTESVSFNAREVGYINYNAGKLLIDIALNLEVGIGTILDVISHSGGLVASVSGKAGHYKGENISTKMVTLNNISGTWYWSGIDTNYKVTIGDKSFSAETSYHREHPDYWNSYQYFANIGLDNYFDR